MKGKTTKLNKFIKKCNGFGSVIFPFIGQPLLQGISGLNETQFNKLMQERKKLIPVWIKAMMKAK